METPKTPSQTPAVTPPRAGALTISDRGWLALRPDGSGPLIVSRMESWGYHVARTAILPDDRIQIAGELARWIDELSLNLVLTTGGTGLGRRDQTPEATLDAVDRPIPGIMEWLRRRSSETNPLATLSRGVAGLRRGCLIINLPGSPRAVSEYLELLPMVLPHALSQVRERVTWAADAPHFEAGDAGNTGSSRERH